MSIERSSIWAPTPLTTRAVPVHLSYDIKSDKITYTSGKSVFVRSVESTLDSIQFLQHNAIATVSKFAPSGFYIASGDETGMVKIWDCVGDDLILKGEYPIISGRINDISWDSESKRIIAVGDGKERYGHCFTWDSGNTIGEISGHSSQINAVTIKPNRPYRAATVSDDAGLVFYQGPPYKFTQSVRGHHNNFIRDVAYSNDGEYIISVGADRKIIVYDGKTGEFVKEIKTDHEGGLFGICWDLNNPKQFVTCSADCSVKLYNVETGDLIKTWQLLPKSVNNQQLGVISTSKYFISLSLDGSLNYWTLDSDTPVRIVQGHQKSITSLASVDGGNAVYSGSYDGKVVKWDTKSGVGSDVKPSKSILSHANLIVSIQLLSNDEVITAAWDDTVKKIDDDVFVNSINIDIQPKMLSSNDEISVVSCGDDKLIIIDNKTFTKKQTITDLKSEPTSLLSISANYIVVGLSSNEVVVYDAKSLDFKTKLPSMTSKPTYAAISPDEKYVAVGDSLGKIVLYNLTTLQIQTSRWSFHTSKINSIAWNEDNDHVVTGSLDTNIIIYSVSKPSRNVKLLNAHKDGVNTVCWTLADKFASGGNDSCIKTWNVRFE